MIKTVSLTANQEKEIELKGGRHVSIENRGTGIVYASKTSGVVAGKDGVIAIDGGASKKMKNVAWYCEKDGRYNYHGKIYLLSDIDCNAEIETGDYFFKSENTAKGGGAIDAYTKAETDNLLSDKANTSDLTDYVKNTDYASTSKAGIVKVNNTYGTGISNNTLELISATENDINVGSNDWKPITPYKVPKVMKKYGINSETQISEMQEDIANKVNNDIFVAENIIKYPYVQMFESRLSVQFTYDDGVITLNGISNDGSTDTVATMNLYTHFTLKDGQYTLSANSSSSKIGLRLYGHDENGVSTVIKTVYGNSVYVHDTTSDGFAEYSLNLRVLNNYGGTEFVNDTIKPMFEIGSIAHRYQPYSLSRKAMRDDIDAILALSL